MSAKSAKGKKGPSRLKDILYKDDAELMPIMPVVMLEVGDKYVTQAEHTAYIHCVGLQEQRSYVPKRGTSSKKVRHYVCVHSQEAKVDKMKESAKRESKKRKRDEPSDETDTAGERVTGNTDHNIASTSITSISSTDTSGALESTGTIALHTNVSTQIDGEEGGAHNINDDVDDDDVVYCCGAIKIKFSTKNNEKWVISDVIEHSNCSGGTRYLSQNIIAKQLIGE